MPTSDKSPVLSSYSECFCQLSFQLAMVMLLGSEILLGQTYTISQQFSKMYDNEIHGEVHTNI